MPPIGFRLIGILIVGVILGTWLLTWCLCVIAKRADEAMEEMGRRRQK